MPTQQPDEHFSSSVPKPSTSLPKPQPTTVKMGNEQSKPADVLTNIRQEQVNKGMNETNVTKAFAALFPFTNAPYLDNNTIGFAKKYRTELAASLASISSTLVAFPLDTIKARIQTSNLNFSKCAQDLWKEDGVAGAFRGVLAPLVSIAFVRTISFSVYQKSKYFVNDIIDGATGESPLIHANTVGAWPNLSTVATFGIAGAASGFLVTGIACPFEYSKVRSQLLPHIVEELKVKGKEVPKNNGAFRFMYSMIKTEGVLALYPGFRLHLIRDTIGTSVYFMTYESCKQILANARGNSPVSPTAVVIAGGMCGLLSWAAVYPIDANKTNYQKAVLTKKYHATEPDVPVERVVYSRQTYRGVTVSMIRSAVLNAVFFSVFEFSKKQINKLEYDDELD